MDDGENGETENVIKSVETSVSIIESLKQTQPAQGSEIAEHAGSSKANVSKHFNTLRKYGSVTKIPMGTSWAFGISI